MFGKRPGRLGIAGSRTLIQRAISILRRFGTDAHVYLPGVGMLNGLQAANFIDSAGTTQGTVDQPVGLVLDAAGSLGVELVPTSGGWIAEAGFIGALSNIGPAAITVNCASQGSAYSTGWGNLLALGKTSKVVLKISNYVSGGVGVRVGYAGTVNYFSANGTFSVDASVAGGNTALYIHTSGAASLTVTINSVREVTGIHASQPTTSAKPILRRGAVNVLNQSHDLPNANWVKNAGVSVSGSVVSGATALAWDAAGSLQKPTTVLASTTYTSAVKIRSSGATTATMRLRDGGTGLFTDVVMPLTSAYSWAVVTRTTGASTTSLGLSFGAADGSFELDGAALFQGTLTAAQIQALGGIPLTTTAPTSTALGPYFWQFDGSNDSLSLGGPLFQMADDHCVVAGLNSTTAAQAVISLAGKSGSYTKAGAIVVVANGSIAARWTSDSVTDFTALSGISAIGVNHVASAVKRGFDGVLRVDGVARGATGLATCVASGLNTGFIGRESLDLTFRGDIYPVIAIKGTVTDPDLLLLEKFVGQLSGVQI